VKNSTIIHSHSLDCGGLGDFFRSLISFCGLCKQNDINFAIDLEQNPLLGACFKVRPIDESIKFEPVEYKKCIDGIGDFGTKFIAETIRRGAESRLTQVILSNCAVLGDRPLVLSGISSLKEEIGPSELTLAKIQELYQRHGLKEGNYASFHLRCGDLFMTRRFGFQRYRKNIVDHRVSLATDSVEKYSRLLLNCVDRVKKDSVLIVHSDSIEMKSKLKKSISRSSNKDRFVFLDVKPQHTASYLGENSIDSFAMSVAEFYIISTSINVFMPIYSGFSHLAAVLGDVSLFGPENPKQWHRDFMESFGPSNLSQI